MSQLIRSRDNRFRTTMTGFVMALFSATADAEQKQIAIEAIVAPFISVRTLTPQSAITDNKSYLQAALAFEVESNRPNVSIQVSATDLQRDDTGPSPQFIALDYRYGALLSLTSDSGSPAIQQHLPLSAGQRIRTSRLAKQGFTTPHHLLRSANTDVLSQEILLTLRWKAPSPQQTAGRYHGLVVVNAYNY